MYKEQQQEKQIGTAFVSTDRRRIGVTQVYLTDCSSKANSGTMKISQRAITYSTITRATFDVRNTLFHLCILLAHYICTSHYSLHSNM